jgi:tetratricopeptide (TPR) repeat protein
MLYLHSAHLLQIMFRKGIVKSEDHLIDQIKNRNSDTANFALLIGAGASATSGVKLARDMVNEWRLQLYKQSHTDKSLQKWLSEQEWYEDPEEYSILFEQVFDEAPQRRNYIEDCMRTAKPSWGYIYLANILAHNYFNIVFTPNFDDLLNEACFRYTHCRPIVCAHDSAVSSIRVTLKRQKIIKLHGDFLYDNIKNTRAETETLEKNMRDKFSQCCNEYGLVVVGYGGNDKSIMDTLEILQRSNGCFPHGIYWCVRKNTLPSRMLSRFLEKSRIYTVEIEGFDDFMAKLHDNLGLNLPDEVTNPYQATTDRLNQFIMQPPVNRIVYRDINALAQQIISVTDALCKTGEPVNALIPYFFIGIYSLNEGEVASAINCLTEAINQNDRYETAYYSLSVAYLFAGELEKSREIARKLANFSPPTYRSLDGAAYLYRHLNMDRTTDLREQQLKMATTDQQKLEALTSKANDLNVSKEYEQALLIIEDALKINPNYNLALINKALSLKGLDRIIEIVDLLRELVTIEEDEYHKAGIYALLNETAKMLDSLRKAVAHSFNRAAMKLSISRDTIFEEYWSSPDFKEVVYFEIKDKKLKNE